MENVTVLIFSFFLKVWAVITRLTIADSLSLQAQQTVVLQVAVSDEDVCLQLE